MIKTYSPHFFTKTTPVLIRRLCILGEFVDFWREADNIQVSVKGMRIPSTQVHVHLNNSPMMTKVLTHANLSWQLNVVRRITEVSLAVPGKVFIVRLKNWSWFARKEATRSLPSFEMKLGGKR